MLAYDEWLRSCESVEIFRHSRRWSDAWRWWTPTRRVVWMMRSSWFLKIPSISWKVFPVGALLLTTSFEIRDCVIELISRKEKNTKSIERFNSIRQRTQAPVSCITLTARSWLNQRRAQKIESNSLACKAQRNLEKIYSRFNGDFMRQVVYCPIVIKSADGEFMGWGSGRRSFLFSSLARTQFCVSTSELFMQNLFGPERLLWRYWHPMQIAYSETL